MKKILVTFVLCALCVASMAAEKREDPYQEVAVLMEILELVRQDYVDSSKVGYDRLVRGAIKGMMGELDPFSGYLPPRSFDQYMEENEGQSFVGIGVEVVFNKDHKLQVITPLEDMPAFKAGVRPGDIIVTIDGTGTEGKSMRECAAMLSGRLGTEARLLIYRPSEDRSFPLTIRRDKISVSTVKGRLFPEKGIAYLRITQFALNTAKDLEKAITECRAQGMKALILDLRDNPGGLLSSSVEVCAHFLPPEKLVVKTVGRRPSQVQEFIVEEGGLELTDIPLAVLINRFSASAAEIVTACLKDYGRGIVIGEKSFGKGTVQNLVPLPDHRGAVRLTTAEYLSPAGKHIHNIGVEPDIVVETDDEQLIKLFRQRALYPGVIEPKDENAIRDETLERAVEVLKGVLLLKGKDFEK